jgi:translocation and assembly module TamA
MELKSALNLKRIRLWLIYSRNSKALLWVMVLACCLALPSPSHSEEISYQVTIEGVEKDTIKSALEASSNLVQLKEKPLSSSLSLILRARDDQKRLPQVLKSFGLYSGKARIEIEGQPVQTLLPSELPDKESLEIVINIETGPVYTLDRIQIRGMDQPGLKDLQIALKPGDPALGQTILNAGRKLISRIKLAGYPFARLGKRKLLVNHRTKTMNVLLEMDPGPVASLGTVTINGLKEVKEEFILKRIPWQAGDDYDPRTLEKFRSDLSGLGVFSSIRLNIPEKLDLEKEDIAQPLPVQLDVEERKPRFFGVGGDFSTNQGVGLNAFWGHRNFFGEADKLKIKGRLARLGENELNRIDQKLGLDFQKPDFISRHQELLFNAELGNENPDAFTRKSISSALGLNRQLSKTISVSGSVKWEFSSIEDAIGKNKFSLFGFPMGIKHDTTKNLLDPHSGFRNELLVTPYVTVTGTGGQFTKFKASSRGYYKATDDGSVVLAGRVLLGSIVGSASNQIAADKRYFAGGGGSVRGYEFQNVGPLDNENKPVGGGSLIEVGVEARFRYKDYGLVPFIDGGNIFDSQVPKFDENLQWGVGLGFRYYSKIGPLRLDLAVPLNRRKNDDPIAFYISIGQSF